MGGGGGGGVGGGERECVCLCVCLFERKKEAFHAEIGSELIYTNGERERDSS